MRSWGEERWRQRWKGGGRGECGVAVGGLGSGVASRGHRAVKYRQRSDLVNSGDQGVRRRVDDGGSGCGHQKTCW